MGRALRWILLLPGVLASWLGTFYVFAEYHLSLTAPCDSAPSLPECTDPLRVFLVMTLPAIGAAVSAVLVLLVTYLIAPTAKMKAVRICFGVGAAIAFTGAWANMVSKNWDMFSAACAALVAGTIAIWLISRVVGAKEAAMTPNTSLERTREG